MGFKAERTKEGKRFRGKDSHIVDDRVEYCNTDTTVIKIPVYNSKNVDIGEEPSSFIPLVTPNGIRFIPIYSTKNGSSASKGQFSDVSFSKGRLCNLCYSNCNSNYINYDECDICVSACNQCNTCQGCQSCDKCLSCNGTCNGTCYNCYNCTGCNTCNGGCYSCHGCVTTSYGLKRCSNCYTSSCSGCVTSSYSWETACKDHSCSGQAG